MIVALSLVYFIIVHRRAASWRKKDHYVRSQSLVSPTADSDLAKLESDVILSALASSILPRSEGTKVDINEKGLSSDEAEEIIDDFKKYDDFANERWERVSWVVGIVGGLAFLGISIARAVVEKDWRIAILPVSQDLSPRSHDLISIGGVSTDLRFVGVDRCIGILTQGENHPITRSTPLAFLFHLSILVHPTRSYSRWYRRTCH